jgi:hypothetical protein
VSFLFKLSLLHALVISLFIYNAFYYAVFCRVRFSSRFSTCRSLSRFTTCLAIRTIYNAYYYGFFFVVVCARGFKGWARHGFVTSFNIHTYHVKTLF